MNLQVLIFILGAIFTAVFAIVSYLVKNKMEELQEKIKDFEQDSKHMVELTTDIKSMKLDISANAHDVREFRDNYLDRFAAITSVINDAKIDVIREIAKLSNKINGHSK